MSMSGAGPSSPSGVVRNSALAFVDAQQPQAAHTQDECMQDTSRDQMGQTDRMPMPAGLKALCEVYSRLYPDQPNPLQVTTRLKYWLGGHDPLDYISMYWNPGKPEENIPPHWHYVSFGISDLHGDGRVHPPSRDGSSGLGLELTFRLHADGHSSPPLWPAALLQATARYMFTYNNKFCAGDHISWHAPLDPRAASRVRHLLVSSDPQLAPARTSHGAVQFLQLVGCTGRELRAAQRGSGFDVLKLISEDPRCDAGSWLVTRVNRRVSARGVRLAPGAPAQLAGVSARLQWAAVCGVCIFHIAWFQLVGCTGRELRAAQRGSGFDVLKLISEDPRCDAGSWLVTRVNRRVSARGVRLAPGAPAQLAGVSARLQWAAVCGAPTEAEPSPPELPACVEQQIKDTLQRGLSSMSSERTGPEGHMSTDSFEMSSIERALPHVPELMQDSRSEGLVEYFDEVHIVMNAEGASLLPLAIDGRVSHGRHFTWREGERAVTLVPPSVAGAIATPAHPLAASGAWLQVLIPKELAEDMSKKVAHLSQLAETDSESDSDEEASKQSPEPIVLPLTLSWPKYRIKITVVKNHELLYVRCDTGSWLVTRVNRRVSVRGVRLAAQLAGVSARLQWAAVCGAPTEAEPSPPELPACVEQQIKDTLQRGLSSMSSERTGPEGHMSTDSFEMSSIERALPHVPELMQDSRSEGLVEYFDEVHIVMNAEGASLLPLAIDGRVSHGRHFTWREGERAVTLVPPSVAGAIATPARPLAASGAWLQVLIPKELAEDMSKKVSHLSQLAETDSESDSDEEASKQSPEPIVLPLTLTWPKYRIKITVVKNHELL
ncbi:uncharacterized protein LOC114364683 [Ostrinia furnacalis]|uniref:uncharacterized protein LOC114364683 n=1 Tax=Ostrinia furnacalis TaxID=93504 RepID=UPI00103D31EF|nr:uncharacterized protein LOC114364683 [Ostrinia furnacalis]